MTTPQLSSSSLARGRLTDEPLAELLSFALGERLSGTLLFQCPAGRKGALQVHAGHIIKARTEAPPVLCASPALEEQLARQVSWLGRLPPRTAFAFHREQDLLRDLPPAHADPLALIWRSLRDADDVHPRQTTVLAALAGRKLRPHTAAAPERFGLSESEQMVVTALRTRPRALDELLQAGLSDPERVQRLVYVLALTHHLDDGQGHTPLDTAAPVSRVPVSSRRGSEFGASFELASEAGREAAPCSSAPRSRTDSARASQPPLEGADTAFHAARQHAARQQYADAARLARQASETDPGNAEYLALHAWLRAQLGELSNPHAAEHILAALDRAVLKQRTSSQIRFLRGQVLRRLGREEDAFKDFRFVLRSEPTHIDAAREVRLYQLRKHKSEKKSGLFARLFLR